MHKALRKTVLGKTVSTVMLLSILVSCSSAVDTISADQGRDGPGRSPGTDTLYQEFKAPPRAARPGVYWYFMDGNLAGDAMIADLTSMNDAGLGNLVFLEVNVGVPRGPVDFMSDTWQDLFARAVHHAEKVGIDITLGAGPGWTGSGGPWVKAEDSMQHLVFSEFHTKGPAELTVTLPLPKQRSTTWHTMKSPFYEDVFVYAFPRCDPSISDIDEKALYERDPYTSKPGVKPYIPMHAEYPKLQSKNILARGRVIDLTGRLDPDGKLSWKVPEGEWTILRMGRRSTGASTRPAPRPGVGFDHDKFDAKALEDHFDHYYGTLLEKVGKRSGRHGWTTIHLDSWEMGAQNWTPKFRNEFRKRRGYDPAPYFITFSGRVIESVEVSERFLWDVRITAEELVLENYAGHIKELGRRHGFELSIEPYDMNPTADLNLGAIADVPMCEFWSEGYGFNSSFSCIESSSIAHTMGRSIVSAEAFTAGSSERWLQYPWSMKNQGDWAFCIGINRFVYHTFAHKPLGDAYRPGMTMGPYGVHWDRGQTWWPLVKDYHEYVTRCSHLLRRGVTVSDILYLTPEGAPHVFRPPADALAGTDVLPDKKGYGFDGCSPRILRRRASVENGRIAFPGGSSYSLLVLPNVHTMTPELVASISELVEQGATVVGSPPLKSPSLTGYPGCDQTVKSRARRLWGGLEPPPEITKRSHGRGALYWGGELSSRTGEGEQKDEMPLQKSKWIWHAGENAMEAPPATRYFRRVVLLDEKKPLASATAFLTADNAFTLWINGKKAETGDNFTVIKKKAILPFLKPGPNVFAIEVINGGEAANPAGLIAAFDFSYADGTTFEIGTDESWFAAKEKTPEWKTALKTTASNAWKPAQVLGGWTMKPWNLRPPAPALPHLYPSYETVASLLKELGVCEDFTSKGPVRYAHRRSDAMDIYIVSNRSDASVETTCVFRIADSRPELWHPVTGRRRSLPQFTRKNGVTTIPLCFAPYESFFVVFPRQQDAAGRKLRGINFPEQVNVCTVNGPWEVRFDPKWGGPEKVVFRELEDWTTRSERGIKYYSGIAVYRTTFTIAEGICRELGKGRRFSLDLGKVHDLASVRVNGKDAGTAWCAPWRCDISHAVKPGTNSLEIRVANRWSNRMLGDRTPPDANARTVKWPEGFLDGKSYKTGRYTFATIKGPGRLLPSGLIGPVTILITTR